MTLNMVEEAIYFTAKAQKELLPGHLANENLPPKSCGLAQRSAPFTTPCIVQLHRKLLIDTLREPPM
jgi:hypothetical protein